MERETADARSIFRHPLHPYTRGLIASIPVRGRRGQPLHAIPGAPPRLYARSEACAYRERCPLAGAVCAVRPPVVEVAAGHTVACHRAAETTGGGSLG